MQHGGNRSLCYHQNGKQQNHARGWPLLSQLWPGQRWANQVVITVLTAWHFPAVSPCTCMEQPREHTGTAPEQGNWAKRWYLSMELDVFSTPLKQNLSRKLETGNLSDTFCINQLRHWFFSHPFQSFCKTTLRDSFYFPIHLLVLEELQKPAGKPLSLYKCHSSAL